MRRPTPLIIAVAALVLWTVYCLYTHAPRVEAALLSESEVALATAGLSDVQPDFSGRGAVLSGTVASPDLRAEAERIVAGVEGVLSVENQLAVADVLEPRETPPYLEIRSRPEGVTLSGPVPSEAHRQELVQRARHLYGDHRVDDRLVVDAATVDSSALASAAEVLGVLAGTRQELQARLEGESFRLSGTMPDRESRRLLEEQARAAAPRIRLFFSALKVGHEEEETAGNESTEGIVPGGERVD